MRGAALHSVRQRLCGVSAAGERCEADIELAKELGAEAIEYVEETQRRLEEQLSAQQELPQLKK